MDLRQFIDQLTITIGPVSISTDLGKRKAEMLRRLKALGSDKFMLEQELYGKLVPRGNALNKAASSLQMDAEGLREFRQVLDRSDAVEAEIGQINAQIKTALLDLRSLGVSEDEIYDLSSYIGLDVL